MSEYSAINFSLFFFPNNKNHNQRHEIKLADSWQQQVNYYYFLFLFNMVSVKGDITNPNNTQLRASSYLSTLLFHIILKQILDFIREEKLSLYPLRCHD